MKNRIYHKSIILITVLYVVLPYIPLVLWSVSGQWNFPTLVPEFSLRTWKYIFQSNEIIRSLGMSVFISTSVTLLSLFVGLPISRILGLYNFKGKWWIRFFVILPAIVPSIAVGMGLQIMFIRMGLDSTVFGVILAQMIPSLPYMILNLSSVFSNYSLGYEEQATMLGASTLTRITQITLPAILPGLVVACLYTFIVSWSQYLLTLMIGGGRIKTLTILLFSYLFSGDYALAATTAILFIFPALFLVWLSSHVFANKKKEILTQRVL